MIDMKFLRENPEAVKENIKKKFQDKKLPLVDEVIALDAEVRKTQQEGMTLYGGTVDFECCDYHYSEIFQRIWDIIEKEDDGSNFRQIDTNLSY